MSTEASLQYQNSPPTALKGNPGEYATRDKATHRESDTQVTGTTNKLKSPEQSSETKEKLQALLNRPVAERSHLINLKELKRSSKYGRKVYADAVYEGELEAGKRDGLGVMLYVSGRVYEGGWKKDHRDGKGYEKYSNGSVYEGDYIEGVPDGRGIYTWPNGEIYDGEWKKGLKYGDGVWKGTHGDSYIGEWKDSKADGYGVHVWKNGSAHCNPQCRRQVRGRVEVLS